MRLVSTVLLLLVATPARAGLELDDTVFAEPTLGLRLQIPDGWRASTQTGYPGLLVLLQATSYRSRIILGASYLPAGKSLAQFVAENASALRALGMTVLRSQPISQQGRRMWELAVQVSRDLEVRQLCLTQGNRAFTLTLAGPSAELPRMQGELLQVLAGLSLR